MFKNILVLWIILLCHMFKNIQDVFYDLWPFVQKGGLLGFLMVLQYVGLLKALK